MQNVGTKNVFTPKNIDGTMFSNEHLVSIRCGVLGSQFFFFIFLEVIRFTIRFKQLATLTNKVHTIILKNN